MISSASHRKAADQGLAAAQHNLGVVYYNGLGVPEDCTEAVKWMREAADQDAADAQAKLGAYYTLGKCLPKDYVQAYMWVNLASAGKFPNKHDRDDAINLRVSLTSRMTPAQMDARGCRPGRGRCASEARCLLYTRQMFAEGLCASLHVG